MAVSAAAVGTSTTTVFDEGPHDVKVEIVQQCEANDLPKPLVVAAPTDAGSYPVLVFLHGWNLNSCWYKGLLGHVASHGFIAVAPQLYVFSISLDDNKDIATTKQVTNWLAGGGQQEQGLLYVLRDVLKLDAAVEPDLSRLALAGHSRGGDTAFATALGLKGRHNDTPLDLAFSALVGVDPVAGLAVGPLQVQVAPKVLTGSFDPRMPALVVGTGLGPDGSFLPPTLPCAPTGVNHLQFYEQCAPPRYHFAARDYGHLDVLDDDGVPALVSCMCKRNPEHSKELCRRTMAGLMVAFLKAKLEGDGEDLEAVLQNPGLAPAVLDQVCMILLD